MLTGSQPETIILSHGPTELIEAYLKEKTALIKTPYKVLDATSNAMTLMNQNALKRTSVLVLGNLPDAILNLLRPWASAQFIFEETAERNSKDAKLPAHSLCVPITSMLYHSDEHLT
jgi:hypothetical protein